MKPFNLEAAKRGEPIVCRDGTPAKFIVHVPEATKENLVVLIDRLVFPSVEIFNESGKFYGDGSESSFDLFMAPKKRTVWVNLYPNNVSYHYKEQTSADSHHAEVFMYFERIGNRAYPVEIEE